jgi:putative transport protein
VNTIAELLRHYPELAVFICLAAGYWIGKFKWRGVGLGTVVGTLVVGLVVGQARVELSPLLRTVFFALFMFATGYQVGPQFFSGLGRNGLRMMAMSLVFCLTGLAAILLMAKLFGFDQGFAAGLCSGALTQSSVIGTATDAIMRLNLPEELKQKLASHVPVGDAVTYLFGTAGVALFLSKLAPRLLRAKLKEESADLEKELGGGSADKAAGVFDAFVAVDVQAFRVTEAALAGKTVEQVERELSGDSGMVYVQRMRRGRRLFTPGKTERVQKQDLVVLSGGRELLLKAQASLGELVVDADAMDMPFETVPVILTRRALIGKTLGELRDQFRGTVKGMHLRRILRQNQSLPRLINTRVARGDVFEFIGRHDDIDRIAAELGYADRPKDATDIIFLGLAVVVGTLVGLLSIKLGNVPVGLGTSGGVLVAGLVFGWLHSVKPQWGGIPSQAVWLMQTLGLNTFVAAVGISAGPHAVEAMRSNGIQLVLAGVFVSLLPHLVTLFFGRYALRMNMGLLLGACAGAGTCTAALQSAIDDSESDVPALGYTIPYALSNVLLTAWGPVIVAVLS